ncbi:MAG TPA: cellulase family glycosylhydrolase [Acidimicrobiales bacterium]|nr:cellulase family glycosylhydrolase [Acidimicrobiales bacterium]
MTSPKLQPFRLVASILAGLLITGLAAVGFPARPAGATSSALGERAGFSPGGPFIWSSDADLARDLDAMAATGARWVRVDFDWSSIEASPGSFNWGPTDRVVNQAQARGLRIIALPAYTPAWARPPGTTDKYPPSQPSTFGAFVRAAVQRYSPSGVKTWEIWNEPNITGFWQPKPNAAAYTALLQAGASAVRGVDPSATVLSAGLSPATDAADGSQVSPITFLRQIYAANGGPSFDAVGIHPYSFPAMPMDPTTASWNTFYRLPLLRDVMVTNGDSAKQIWATEFGAPTSGSGAVSESVQSQMVTEAYNAFTSWSWTGPLLWYSYRDQGTNALDREDNFGMVRRDFTPKAAAATFTALMTAPAPTTTTTVAPTTTTTVAPTTTTTAPTAPAPVAPQGYRTVSSDGSSVTYRDGLAATSTPPVPIQTADPVIGAAARHGGGTWATTGKGAVFAIGGAPFLGSLAGQRLNKPIVGVAATPSGGGYWLVASDGGVFAFGDARFAGSTGAVKLNRLVIGMTSTPSGAGYWLVASDGGVFAFGDARFLGSTGAIKLNRPIVGMTSTPSGAGYWLVASDGGVFAFGDALFFGSTGAISLSQPIVGMTSTPSGAGYWLVASDGGIFAFGDARFLGSAPGQGPATAALVGVS